LTEEYFFNQGELSFYIHFKRDWPGFQVSCHYSEPCGEKMGREKNIGKVQRTQDMTITL